MRMRRRVVIVVLAFVAGASVAVALVGSDARAQVSVTTDPNTPPTTASRADGSGVQHLKYQFGPLDITPGQNLIQTSEYQIPHPTEAGWIIGFRPNLEFANGKIPAADKVMLHHAVWAVATRRDPSAPLFPERFMAAGEEKTTLDLPRGYGYRSSPGDVWYLNYMIHNLTAKPFKMFITYEVDFVPASSPLASTMKDVHPIWLDVQNGKTYPVFDALKGSGANGTFTYPDDDPSAPRVNSYTVPTDGVLVKTFGHLHPGGLYDTFSLTRDGKTKKVFTSKATYYEPAGATSWDLSMTATSNRWKVAVKPGDTLSITTTYDTKRASWYESMGLGVVWMYDGPGGTDAFTGKIDQRGLVTHGHLPENDNHGGIATGLANPTTAASGPLATNIPIGSFEYGAGDLAAKGKIPTVAEGQSITFDNLDAGDQRVWHSITACRAPCTASTGIAYPLAAADVQFDSGQLGNDGAPTVGRETWNTPTDLPPGTYTYFCRIHPFMRGAFRVVPSSSPSK